MRLLKCFILLVCLLFVSCGSKIDSLEENTTAISEVPVVVSSNNPNAIIESWEYLNPRSEETLASFLSRDPKSIGFGPSQYEAYIIWREGGFDLVWGNFICSTQPSLIIDNITIELWLNDGIWDDCDAAQVTHAFKVELATDIPIEEWAYTLYTDAPP